MAFWASLIINLPLMCLQEPRVAKLKPKSGHVVPLFPCTVTPQGP